MITIKESTKLSNGKELDIQYPIRLYDRDGKEVYFKNSYGQEEYYESYTDYIEDIK